MQISDDILKGLENPIFQDNTKKFEKEQKFGKKLLATAWAVEIMAASLGLLIAFFMAFDAYNSNPTKDASALLNAILGALPFLLIAIIEPTKIPLAGGLYRVRNIGWKALILVTMIGLTAVTFETMFTGLERQLTNVTSKVTFGKSQIMNLDSLIQEKESLIKKYEEIDLVGATEGWDSKVDTIRSEHQKAVAVMQDRHEKNVKALADELNRYKSEKDSIEGEWNSKNSLRLSALQDALKELREGLKNVENRIKDIDDKTAVDSSISNNEEIERFKSNIRKIEEELQDVSLLFNGSETAKIKEAQIKIGVVPDGKFGPNTQRNYQLWRDQRAKRIEELEVQINNKKNELKSVVESSLQSQRSQFDSLNEKRLELEENISLKNDELEALKTKIAESEVPAELEVVISKIRSVEEKLAAANNEHNLSLLEKQNNMQEKTAQIELSRIEQENIISNQISSIPSLQKEVAELTSDKSNSVRIMRESALNNQIYRFAQKWKGYEDILDVKEEDLSAVAAIWYGSISAICAIIGTILALISYIMTDPDAFVEKQKLKRNNPLRRSIRLALISLRKKINKPRINIVEKIIEKDKLIEVPIEKLVEVERFTEVEKKVEVVVEKIVEVERFFPEIIPLPILLPHNADVEFEMKKMNKIYSDFNSKVKPRMES